MDDGETRPDEELLRYGPFARHSTEELAGLLTAYGVTARENQRRFAGLIPEVLRREYYLTKGCPNVYVFAAVYGGMRRDHVNEVLRLDRLFARTPLLRRLLHRGEVGWSKLRTVAKVARPGTDAVWAGHVREFSKHVLEQFVRDVKAGRCPEAEVPSERGAEADDGAWGFLEAETGAPVRRPATGAKLSPLPVPASVAECVRTFVEELSREAGRPLGLGDGLLRIMAMARSGGGGSKRLRAVVVLHTDPATGAVTQRTREGTTEIPAEALEESYEAVGAFDLEAQKPAPVRYDGWEPVTPDGRPARRPAVPAAIRRWVMMKWGGRCAFPGCNCRATELHHPGRFAAEHVHDPDHLVPLCRAHHSMAHLGLIANEDEPPSQWRLRLARRVDTDGDARRARVDAKVQERRRADGGGGSLEVASGG